MAKKKISELPAGGALNGTELVPIVQTGTTKRITAQDIANLGNASGVEGSGTINYLAKFTATSTIGNSLLFDNGTSIGLGTATPSATYKLDIIGGLRATTIVKSGGTSAEYLKADGSVSTLTNPITGTGTTNYLPKFTGASALGNSIVQDTTIGGIPTINVAGGIFSTNNIETSSGYFNATNLFLGKGSDLISGATANDGAIMVSGSNNMVFGIALSEKMRIASNGNVGIGTTSPATKFHIQDTNGGIFFDGSGATYNRFKSTTSSASTGRDLLFSAQSAGTTPDLYITSAGFVGIGTASPARKLTIQGDDDATMQLRLQGTASTTSYWELGRESSSTGQFRIIASRTGTIITPLAIGDVTGNVMINTTTDAGYKLDVNGTARVSGNATATRFLTNYSYFGGGDNYNIKLNNDLSADSGFIYQLGGSTAIASNSYYNSAGVYTATATSASSIELAGGATVFYNNTGLTNGGTFSQTERMRIVNTGNVLIGTTTDVASSKLTIESTTQGVLVPRMTTTQINAIGSPANGLIAYNTTLAVLCFYDGTGWKRVVHLAM